MRGTVSADYMEGARVVTPGIEAMQDSHGDWRVYEELTSGRYRLIDVKPTWHAVRWQYDPETFPDSEQ